LLFCPPFKPGDLILTICSPEIDLYFHPRVSNAMHLVFLEMGLNFTLASLFLVL
jgi:hypothetical protein